jgi:hypothetical protein
MDNSNTSPQPESTESKIEIQADTIKTIDIKDLPPNSILVIKLDVANFSQKLLVAPAFSKLFKPYAEQLKEKHITILLMAKNESIDVIPEEEMNRAGWVKREKSLIVNPFEK